MGWKRKKKKIVYEDGYEHYGKVRNIQVIFLVNEVEKNLLDDMIAASHETSKSDFIRKRVFGAYSQMSNEQKEQMREVADWRAEDARGNSREN